MKTTKPAVILLALVLLTAAAAQSAEKPAKKEISNTSTASCLVKITTDEAVLPLDEFVVESLLRSSGVAGKAAREVLETSPDFASELFEIEEVYSNVFPDSGGIGGGGYGGGMMGGGYGSGMMGGGYGGGYGGGGYGSGLGGMGLPADATPGASGYGTTYTSRSNRRLPSSTAKAPPQFPGTRTTRPGRVGTSTTTPTGYRSTARTIRRKPTVTQPQPSTTEQTILFHLRVDLQYDEDIKPAAEEFMVALIENLRSALREAFGEYRAKLNDQLKLANEEAMRAEVELVQMQAKLREISGSRDLSRNGILRNISSQRSSIQSTEMRKASDQIEMDAITGEIAETEVKIREKVKNDSITIELQRIVDIQTDSLARIQELVKRKTVFSAEVEDVLEKLARARIELAKRREEISRAQGGDRLSQLSSKLVSYTQRMAQYELSLSSMERQLKEEMDFLDRADNYELLSLKADIARQNLEETLLWRARLGRNNRSIQPPDVTVIGAE